MQLEDRAYLAGLFDGEGCVSVQWGSGTPRIYAVVDMSHKSTVQWLHKSFGGSFSEQTPRNPKHAIHWNWSIGGSKAAEFFEMILPFARVKRHQIEIGLAFAKHLAENSKSRLPITDCDLLIRHKLAELLTSAREKDAAFQ